MADTQAQADALKAEGNTAFTNKDFSIAIKKFSEAIELTPENHVLFSNRSAALASSGDYEQALNDANRTISLKPNWAKGYSRQGAALSFLQRLPEAKAAFEKGLELDANNAQLKAGLAEVQGKMSFGAFGSLFGPDMWAKLQCNPTTAAYLKDDAFTAKLRMLQQNPSSIDMLMRSDPRIQETMGVLLGIDLSKAAAGSDNGDVPMNDRKPSAPRKEPEPEPEPEVIELTEEEQQRKDAAAKKEEGNTAYKMKDFDTALTHYRRAQELDPDNIVYLLNEAAVCFETNAYDETIAVCNKAVDIGREKYADFKLIAKAFGRIGSAYLKKNDLEMAVSFFNKSLTEHRTPDILTKKQKAEKELKKIKESEYIDPSKAEAMNEEGKSLFIKGDFGGAVKAYSEAIKRNPAEPKFLSNRAACYTKLMEYHLAVQDADEAIKLDKTFIKGYTRKGASLYFLGEYRRAYDTYEEALEVEPTNKECIEGRQRCVVAQQLGDANKSREQRIEEARNDPEVQSILNDPGMNEILRQMQQDPGAYQDHMQNPEIRRKIQKLASAGIIETRAK